MAQDKSNLTSVISKAMIQAANDESTGLAQAKALIPPEKRFQRILENGGKWIVEISSDGLNLTQKLAAERYLKAALIEHGEDSASFSINFKRIGLAGGNDSVHSAPKPIEPKSGPFGIKQRKKAIAGVHRILAVSSGKGGVGKSTISVNLAIGLQRQGKKVGLLDADIYGPSAPLMLGLQGPLPVSAEQKMIPLEAHGVKCVSFGFISDERNPVIWRGPMVSKALEQLFYQSDWGELDYLIVDLPPGTGDVQLTMIERLPIYGGVIVSTPQNVALCDAEKGITMFKKLGVPIIGIVENMSYFACGSCGAKERIFGSQLEAVAEKHGIGVLEHIPLTSSLREKMDNGQAHLNFEGPLAEHFSSLADKVISFSN